MLSVSCYLLYSFSDPFSHPLYLWICLSSLLLILLLFSAVSCRFNILLIPPSLPSCSQWRVRKVNFPTRFLLVDNTSPLCLLQTWVSLSLAYCYLLIRHRVTPSMEVFPFIHLYGMYTYFHVSWSFYFAAISRKTSCSKRKNYPVTAPSAPVAV